MTDTFQTPAVFKSETAENYFPDKKEQANHFSLSTSHAIDESLSTAQSTLSVLDKLSSCVWSRLVLAQSQIESLQQELRVAREGEERAYEALKRLRTRAHARARSSPRNRPPEPRDGDLAVIVASHNRDLSRREHSVPRISEISNFDMVALSSFKNSLLKELQIAQERLAAGAKREEDLRNTLCKAQEKLAGDYWANVGKDGLQSALREQVEQLRRTVTEQTNKVAKLQLQLEQEKLVSARHRDVAATVWFLLFSMISPIRVIQPAFQFGFDMIADSTKQVGSAAAHCRAEEKMEILRLKNQRNTLRLVISFSMRKFLFDAYHHISDNCFHDRR
jgi:hypothetical protein